MSFFFVYSHEQYYPYGTVIEAETIAEALDWIQGDQGSELVVAIPLGDARRRGRTFAGDRLNVIPAEAGVADEPLRIESMITTRMGSVGRLEP